MNIFQLMDCKFYSADDTATTSFVETPPISTYTIAFVVSDFPYRTNTNNPNVFRHRVYARPSGVALTKLGMQEGERLLHALEKYLLVNSTLPKMDQIAIPGFETEGNNFHCPHLFSNQPMNRSIF